MKLELSSTPPASPSTELRGQWAEFRGARWLIAADGNPAHKRELKRLMRPLVKQRRTEDYDATEAAITKAGAKAILLGWENLQSADGAPVPYSVELAERILSGENIQTRELRDFIYAFSKDPTNYGFSDDPEGEEGAASEMFRQPIEVGPGAAQSGQ